jgi:hypothetical protein
LQVLGNIGANSEREVNRAIEVNDMYIESIKAKLKAKIVLRFISRIWIWIWIWIWIKVKSA